MEFIAKANFVRVSPQKARLVLDLIKGQRVEDALNTLLFTKKGVAPAIHKLVRSAMENANYLSAEKGLDLDLDRLYVKNAIANDGPRMKRIRPAPMGRAFRYQRRISHIEVLLAEKPSFLSANTVDDEEKTPLKAKGKKAPAKKAAAKKAPAKKSAAKKTAAKK